MSVSEKTSVNLQPHLTGEFVRLRPLREDDFVSLFAVASDPLIWEQHHAQDRCQEHAFREFFRQGLESGGMLIVIDRKTENVIGTTRFNSFDQEKKQIEFCWTFLARSHWGGKYNREMRELMLRHVSEFVERVIFIVGEQNVRSQISLERIGAQRIGSVTDQAGRKFNRYEIMLANFQFETFGAGGNS